MPPVVRFAPSPTGLVHIGNIRTALLNWCVAKRDGGQFILRYDDTDTARSRQEYADAIAIDLAWLGVIPDLQVRQSERLALYDAAAVMLRGTGRLYPCYETEDELERRRTLQKARGLPPVYDRAALRLTDAQKAAFEAEGRRPHWRFLLDQSVVEWEDGVRGPAHVDTSSLSDPVLIRGDGSYLYTFTSVVDDIDLGVTHIIRGEDHVTNTAVQIEIFEALGGKAPVFAHHNLLTTVSGEGLSKRTGALSIRSLREAGLEPMAVSSLAVLTGTSEAVRPIASLAELAEMVDLSRISRAPARFDPAEIEVLNARLLHETPYAVVAERLAAMGVAGGEPFWLVVRSNVVKLADSRIWWDVVTGPIATEVQDAAFLKNAASVLPSEPWDETTWGSWTHAVRAQTGAKGKALFMPLRKALTGLDHGPELKGLLPLIGREQVLARLKG